MACSGARRVIISGGGIGISAAGVNAHAGAVASANEKHQKKYHSIAAL
jgi:hypothetical protein